MKKLISLSLLSLALCIGACKKDDKGTDDNSYEARLAGTWDLKSVKYKADIPDIIGGGTPTHVEGAGTGVSGNFILKRNPNTLTYNYSFTASVDPFNSCTEIPIPVSAAGQGDWTTTTDGSKIIITEDSTSTTFSVITNEPKRQVFTSTISQNVSGLFTVDVDVELEFTRP